MNCPECGNDMIWQNDWDLSEEVEEGEANQLTMYCCFSEGCDVDSVNVYRKMEI